MRAVFYGLLLAGVISAAAQGQSRDALIEAAHAFDQAALRLNNDNAKPVPVHKCMAYADQAERDHAALKAAVGEGRIKVPIEED
jgi:hypothetical protein